MQFHAKIQEHVQQIIKATTDELMAVRARQISNIPRYALTAEHCEGAKLVSSRDELLNMMASGAVVAELGADQGEFSEHILRLTDPEKFVIVDAWHTERYGDDKALSVAQRFERQIIAGQMEIVRALSVDAADSFESEYFDWIYIDTDPSYETTLAELYGYERTVKKTGFICGHDYVMGNWSSGYKYGVIEAVSEFCVKRNWKIAFLTADYTENPSFALCRI